MRKGAPNSLTSRWGGGHWSMMRKGAPNISVQRILQKLSGWCLATCSNSISSSGSGHTIHSQEG